MLPDDKWLPAWYINRDEPSQESQSLSDRPPSEMALMAAALGQLAEPYHHPESIFDKIEQSEDENWPFLGQSSPKHSQQQLQQKISENYTYCKQKNSDSQQKIEQLLTQPTFKRSYSQIEFEKHPRASRKHLNVKNKKQSLTMQQLLALSSVQILYQNAVQAYQMFRNTNYSQKKIVNFIDKLRKDQKLSPKNKMKLTVKALAPWIKNVRKWLAQSQLREYGSYFQLFFDTQFRIIKEDPEEKAKI